MIWRLGCWRSRIATHLPVPEMLSVAGFDDTTLAQVVWPPLTTIRQPVRDLADTATQLLLGEGGLEHRRLPHELISRESIAAPRTKPFILRKKSETL